ncbi:RsmB/NOP family class I SAM-dependent RNA methyltransferase [Paenibacillus sp. MMS18-CY102]|uniref:RsmB/NOP family class I SAM-dependent RNA methyltransferase n=1 Tax=Paenibacillus sp. MMS18-CY102 TaxID=2682849 RepID=UPI001365FDE5|nr:RsmB/NOP family class I SAM-dependent RNA methyltransferase [Paenibacillus sp. MMS18-CY102]MWC28931.1 rRNA cytosine-C5-methyltransferase [Paenibacillus sp. MMS18-CY102]
MKYDLPTVFVEQMKRLLGEQIDDFMGSYDAPRLYGLRMNSLKVGEAQWAKLSPWRLRPIPWCSTGSYYNGDDRPGKHPYYHAGLYYIQEPSAMAPVELLDVQPGHRVLDLCAAPGGKSTQIAAKLQGTGILVSNDNAAERTKALAKNIELAGVRNAVVLNEEPASLVPVFDGWFDRILVDAPCSGEGMFRKDESMIAAWERHSVERCSIMQRDILRDATAMLAPGGLLVYSTCTFSPAENEAQIAAILAANDELEAVPVRLAPGFVPGRPEWGRTAGAGVRTEPGDESGTAIGAQAGQAAGIGSNAAEEADGWAACGMVRLWPHLLDGEGHFAAVIRRRSAQEGAAQAVQHDGHAGAMHARGEGPGSRGNSQALAAATEPQHRERGSKRSGRGSEEPKLRARGANAKGAASGGKRGEQPQSRTGSGKGGRGGSATAAAIDPATSWREFANEHLAGAENWSGTIVAFGARVYLQPSGMPSLDGLRVVRAGWYLGDAGAYRFEPSQALAMGLKASEAKLSWHAPVDDPAILRYLKGETLHLDPEALTVAIPADTLVKGYTLVCVDGYPLGWGKYASGMLKNELPAGWRWV